MYQMAGAALSLLKYVTDSNEWLKICIEFENSSMLLMHNISFKLTF